MRNFLNASSRKRARHKPRHRITISPSMLGTHWQGEEEFEVFCDPRSGSFFWRYAGSGGIQFGPWPDSHSAFLDAKQYLQHKEARA